jgi:elongation factor P
MKVIWVTAGPGNSQENNPCFVRHFESFYELAEVQAMILALELRAGMVIGIDHQIYKVIEVESKAGAAKMGGTVKTKLINVRSGRIWEPHFRPQEKLENLELERRSMEFLFMDADSCTFMHPDTFEQIEVPATIVGDGRLFLQSGMQVPIEFFQGEAISVLLPDVAEARVLNTALPSHSQQDSAWKEAVLENGLTVRVPLFVGPGEMVRVDVRTGRYVERAHADRRRIA